MRVLRVIVGAVVGLAIVGAGLVLTTVVVLVSLIAGVFGRPVRVRPAPPPPGRRQLKRVEGEEVTVSSTGNEPARQLPPPGAGPAADVSGPPQAGAR